MTLSSSRNARDATNLLERDRPLVHRHPKKTCGMILVRDIEQNEFLLGYLEDTLLHQGNESLFHELGRVHVYDEISQKKGYTALPLLLERGPRAFHFEYRVHFVRHS